MVRSVTWDQGWFVVEDRRRLIFCQAILLAWLVMWCLQPLASFGQSAEVRQEGERATSSEVATPGPAHLDLKTLERLTKETLAKVTPAVVSVGGGSGVVVSPDGHVLTVAHVGGRANRRMTVTFPDGTRVRAKTLGNDHGVDAGLIKLEGDGPYPHVKMGHSKDLQPGQWCLALGYPVSFEHGKPPALRIGRVLRNRDSMIVTDCTIMGGDSGGPLFDLDGNVIAISSRCDDRLTFNIFVPVDCFQNTWTRLTRSEDFNSLRPSIAFLGVGPDDSAESAMIGEVFGGSGAEKAGIQVGDVILKFDGQELSRYDDLPPLIERHKPGDVVDVEILRDGQVVKLQATLSERAD